MQPIELLVLHRVKRKVNVREQRQSFKVVQLLALPNQVSSQINEPESAEELEASQGFYLVHAEVQSLEVD